MPADDLRVIVSPTITADQLFTFYVENDICEKGFGKEIAARVLDRSDLIVGAFNGNRLVGLVRAMFDGLSAQIVEFDLALKYQGEGLQFNNGSLIERDPTGLGKRLGETAVRELLAMGAYFISATQVLAGRKRTSIVPLASNSTKAAWSISLIGAPTSSAIATDPTAFPSHRTLFRV